MPELIDQNTGSTVRVSDAETPFVAQSRFRLPDRVMIVAPDGEVFEAPGADPKVQQALRNGWRIESPEETHKREIQKQYGDSEIRTALEGAASGATFGLSDLAQTKLGIATPEELKGRREANPASFLTGEGLGMAASLLIPGAAPERLVGALGESAIGKGILGAGRAIAAPMQITEKIGASAAQSARLAAESLLPAEAGSKAMAKLLSQGAEFTTRGIVDGAIFGSGQLVSEHALGDTQLNAERIVSRIAESALIGGAAGGALAGLVGVASPIAGTARKVLFDNLDKIPGISKEAAAAWLKEQSHRAALASVGSTTKMFRELEQQGIMDIGPEAFINLKSPIDGKKVLTPGANFSTISKRLTETTNAIGADIGATIDAVDATGQLSGINAESLKYNLTKNVLNPYNKQIGVTTARNAVNSVLGELEQLGTEEVSHRWLQDMRNNLREAYTGNPDLPAKKALRKVERELNSILEESLSKKLSPEAFAEFKRKKDLFSSIKTIEQNAALRAHTLEGNRMFSLSDRITAGTTSVGAIAGAVTGDEPSDKVLGGLAGGYIAQALARQYRTRSPSVLAIFLSKASRMMAIEKIVQKSVTTESKLISQVADSLISGARLPRYNHELEAAVMGARQISDDPLGYSAIGLRGKQHSRELDAAVTGIRDMGQNPGLESAVLGMQDQQYNPELNSAVAGMRTAVDDTLGDIAPEIARVVHERIAARNDFLESKRPTPPMETSMTPSAMKKWTPSKAQSAKYARYVAAVKSPETVLIDIVNGKINNEGVEVLKTLYPAMRNELVVRLTEKLSASKKPLPYKKRVMLATLLDIPNADASLVPEYIASMQSVPPSNPAVNPTKLTNNATKSINKLQTQTMTQSERIASGME